MHKDGGEKRMGREREREVEGERKGKVVFYTSVSTHIPVSLHY